LDPTHPQPPNRVPTSPNHMAASSKRDAQGTVKLRLLRGALASGGAWSVPLGDEHLELYECTGFKPPPWPPWLVRLAFVGCTELHAFPPHWQPPLAHIEVVGCTWMQALLARGALEFLRVLVVQDCLLTGALRERMPRSLVYVSLTGCDASIRIESYGWGRARVLVRRLVLTRRVAFLWYGIAAERHCAPGGLWAERDRLAYIAEFG